MLDRILNTSKSVKSNPDVNSQGQIDEDGESESVGAEDTDVNETAGPDDEAEVEDASPAVYSATIQHNGAHTDINIRVASPTGYQNKRLVLPGNLTANKLAEAIANVANW